MVVNSTVRSGRGVGKHWFNQSWLYLQRRSRWQFWRARLLEVEKMIDTMHWSADDAETERCADVAKQVRQAVKLVGFVHQQPHRSS